MIFQKFKPCELINIFYREKINRKYTYLCRISDTEFPIFSHYFAFLCQFASMIQKSKKKQQKRISLQKTTNYF